MNARLLAFPAVGIVAVAFSTLRPDDAAIQGVGGAVERLGKESNVRMLSETVLMKLPSCVVEANFTFQNEGDTATVLMGFPEDGYNVAPTRKRPTFFRSFKSFVDGAEVRTGVLPRKSNDEGEAYRQWWVKSVPFEKGQIHKVRNVYQSYAGASASDAVFANYIMDTGATWKGKIGYAKIVVDISALKKGTGFTAYPKGFKRQGNTLVWVWKDLEPTVDHNISVWWDKKGRSLDKLEMNTKSFLGDKPLKR
jgi:hypothetical protein